MSKPLALRLGSALVLAGLTAACTDNPMAPTATVPATAARQALECVANVAAQSMVCTPVDQTAKGASLNRIVGGQDVYVKLTNSNTTYDSGTGIFSTSVQVQNLTQQTMGTDGSTVSGVDVFFSEGPSSSAGTVSVYEPDGTYMYLARMAPYYRYAQILQPMEISQSRQWKFQLAGGATTFTFRVYLSTRTTDDAGPLLGPVWTGATDSNWQTASNWSGGAVPDATSMATVPLAAHMGGAPMPVLTANASLLHLRVGTGSTLNLGAFTLSASGNVDGPGTLSNGTLIMTGTGTLLRGNVSALNVSGSTSLQGSVTASGAVSVSGSLTVSDQALSISIP
jgi:hypothetical protein